MLYDKCLENVSRSLCSLPDGWVLLDGVKKSLELRSGKVSYALSVENPRHLSVHFIKPDDMVVACMRDDSNGLLVRVKGDEVTKFECQGVFSLSVGPAGLLATFVIEGESSSIVRLKSLKLGPELFASGGDPVRESGGSVCLSERFIAQSGTVVYARGNTAYCDAARVGLWYHAPYDITGGGCGELRIANMLMPVDGGKAWADQVGIARCSFGVYVGVKCTGLGNAGPVLEYTRPLEPASSFGTKSILQVMADGRLIGGMYFGDCARVVPGGKQSISVLEF